VHVDVCIVSKVAAKILITVDSPDPWLGCSPAGNVRPSPVVTGVTDNVLPIGVGRPIVALCVANVRAKVMVPDPDFGNRLIWRA
jgi:hypothetical protein